MYRLPVKIFLLYITWGFLFSSGYAQTGKPLIDMLVKKGVLTAEEGKEIQEEVNTEYSKAPAAKMNLATHVQKLTLSGDTRMRYQYDSQESNTVADRVRSQSRGIFRVRLGADYLFTDNLSAGVRIETEAGNDSSNTTSDDAFSKNGDINVALAWLKWEKAFNLEWLQLTVGKQKLGHVFSFYTWDSDTNPEGGFMRLGDFDLGGGLTASSTHGFYLYDDTREDNWTVTANEGDNTLLYINQIMLSYVPEPGVRIEMVPGFSYFSGSDPNVAPVGQTGVDAADLAVLSLQGAFVHTLPYNLQGKLYGEYGVNLSGDDRAGVLTGDKGEGRNQYFVAGYKLGDNKKKGDWSLDGSYAYYETFSWDPNLNDSTFHASLMNGQGYTLAGKYNFTDFVTGALTWSQSWAIDPDVTAVNGLNAIGGNRISKSDAFLMDLEWKF